MLCLLCNTHACNFLPHIRHIGNESEIARFSTVSKHPVISLSSKWKETLAMSEKFHLHTLVFP